VYSVALVQNQSEMSHYGYADTRPLLRGYRQTLFTGDDIQHLVPVLADRKVDALVLATNALNDRNILRALCRPEFAAVLEGFLASGRGLLCMQQIGLAMRNGPTLDLLPEAFGRVRPRVRPAQESAQAPSDVLGSPDHLLLTYPSLIDLETTATYAFSRATLTGLYWHYWDQVDSSAWDVVVRDTAMAPHRALVLCAKESGLGRVVLSAIPLDWQNHTQFMRNLLSYAVEGRHSLAVIEQNEDLAFDYLRHSLHARRVAYGEYPLDAGVEECARHIRSGVHTTLLVGSGVVVDQLPPELTEPIEEAVRANRLRVVDIADRVFDTRRVALLSRELRPRALLRVSELRVQAELREGYIDDSFWSHVETLQTLDRMPDRVIDYGLLQEPAFAIARNHDRADSYDEIFGPTCALYWFRARYLGAQSDEARRTESWLRQRLDDHAATERALAYLMLGLAGQHTTADAEAMKAMVRQLNVSDLTESEILLVLRALLTMESPEPEQLAQLSEELIFWQRNGVWVDLTTTAAVTTALLFAHRRLDAGRFAAVCSKIERAALEAVVHILEVLAAAQASAESHPYPWDGKARTTMKCLQAWLMFDELLDLPVSEMLDLLERAGEGARVVASSRSALEVLQVATEESAELRLKVQDLERRERELTEQAVRFGQRSTRILGRARWAVILLVVLLSLVYVVGSLLVGALIGRPTSLGDAALTGFVDGWQVHFAVVGALTAIVGVWLTIRSQRHGRPTDPAVTGGSDVKTPGGDPGTAASP
jgi:hypothetical protein